MSTCPSVPTVILIDDDPFEHLAFRRIIRRCNLLEPIATFVEPDTALKFLNDPRSARVDIIFLDLQMPTMTGLQFLRKASASLDGDLGQKMVVVLSSSDRHQDIEQSFSYDLVKLYFEKPLTIAGVEQVVRIFLGIS